MNKRSIGSELGKEMSETYEGQSFFEDGKTVEISEKELEELKAKAKGEQKSKFF